MNAVRFEESGISENADITNTESFIAGLSALVGENPQEPLLNREEKLTAYAKELAGEYLDILLERNDDEYEKVLAVLRDVERDVRNHIDDTPYNYEISQIVRCMRGKLVYKAHLIYALEHYPQDFPQKSNVYTFLKEKGYPHKRYSGQSVYRAAMVISRDKKDREPFEINRYGVNPDDERALEEDLNVRARDLANQNKAIVEADLSRQEGLGAKVLQRLRNFAQTLNDKRREIIYAGAVAATVVAISIFGSGIKRRYSNYSEESLETSSNITSLVEPQNLSPNLPSVDFSAGIMYPNQVTLNEGGNEEGTSINTVEVEEHVPPLEMERKEIPHIAAETKPNISDDSPNTNEEGAKQVVYNDIEETARSDEVVFRELSEREKSLYRLVDRSNPLEASFVPEVVNLREHGIPTSNPSITGAVEAVDDLKALFDRARELGIDDIYIGSGYRSYLTQKSIYDKAQDKRWYAKPGTSQHQTGRAFDFTTRSIGFAIDSRAGFENTPAAKFLQEEAYKFGFVQSYADNRMHDGVPDEPWHLYYVGKDLAKAYVKLKDAGWEGDIFVLLAWIQRTNKLPLNANGEIDVSAILSLS